MWQWLRRTIGLTGASAARFWASYFGGRANYSNEPVNTTTAMSVAAFNRGVKLYAETVSTLPLNVYLNELDGSGTLVRDPANQYDAVLRISPNEDQTTVEFWEGIIGAYFTQGNGYAKKLRVNGRLVGLQPVDQSTTYPYRETGTNRLYYRGSDLFGQPFDLPASEIFHLKGFNFGGDAGVSPIWWGAHAISMQLAAQKTAGKLLGSGLSASGFLETGQVLDEPDRERLTKIMQDYMGSDNAGKMMVLEGGMKWNAITIKPVDAELLATLGWGVEEIGRLLGIPVILLGHNADGQTMWGSGLEAIIGAWYTLGLRALLTKIEKAIGKRIIEPADAFKFYAKYNVDGLLRGDSAAQAALFSAALQNGWMTRNEVRRLLELPPIPGGDEVTVQVNMTLLKDLGSKNQDVAQTARNALRLLIGIDDGPAIEFKKAA